MTCPACVDPERRAQRPRQIIRLATKILGWTWVNSGFYIDARRARLRRYRELWLLQKPVQALTEYHARIEPRARRHRNNAGYALPPADLFKQGVIARKQRKTRGQKPQFQILPREQPLLRGDQQRVVAVNAAHLHQTGPLLCNACAEPFPPFCPRERIFQWLALCRFFALCIRWISRRLG